MPSWKASVNVTDKDGNEGTASAQVSGAHSMEATTALLNKVTEDGYTPSGRIDMTPTDRS